ncbi:right-handed parallel beta-helix repeat-containing protein [Microbulbifer sp. OS29]|uniref:Right-handed parallel beta-helix repeat-containing protein n=1 Tax=Microbulbifer okhotskensis TaxID=2926617 RepID=A0A9X2EML4_9GAMM|nr:right-handed parallel beta-helix repeat-containing protein [Microbulbifer okhotskensis]MCO1335062.1 right-handed parallel beta-helix repeat-containing protein [Microbulbifer okhotskensis]
MMKRNENSTRKLVLATVLGFYTVSAAGLIFGDVQCGDVVTGIETMNQDLIDCSSNPAVTVQGPTGFLFMNGHIIQCDLGDGVGVLLDGMAGFLSGGGEVRQCTIGVSVGGNGFHTVQEVFTFVNQDASIEIVSDYNSIRLNELQNSLFNGVNVLGDNNTIIDNALFNFGGIGIYVNGDGTFISGNSIDINGGDMGISLDATNGSRIIQNEITNADDGISMTASGQMNNVVSGNVVSGSSNLDLWDQNANACTSTNSWVGNAFTTADPVCID